MRFSRWLEALLRGKLIQHLDGLFVSVHSESEFVQACLSLPYKPTFSVRIPSFLSPAGEEEYRDTPHHPHLGYHSAFVELCTGRSFRLKLRKAGDFVV
jgi:hypothetical protein